MNKMKFIKTFATNVAISFFFAAIFVFTTYMLFDKKINYYTSLINSIAIKQSDDVENKQSEYNHTSKKITNRPRYGKKFATLKIPEIDMNLPIYHGDTLDIMRYGVGHYGGSYFPGEVGTIILAAHNDVGFFHEIDRLVEGSKITIEADYGTFEYEVDSYKVVNETDLDAFQIQEDKELLIMYTCYPIRHGVVGRRTQRYIVYANRVGDDNA